MVHYWNSFQFQWKLFLQADIFEKLMLICVRPFKKKNPVKLGFSYCIALEWRAQRQTHIEIPAQAISTIYRTFATPAPCGLLDDMLMLIYLLKKGFYDLHFTLLNSTFRTFRSSSSSYVQRFKTIIFSARKTPWPALARRPVRSRAWTR